MIMTEEHLEDRTADLADCLGISPREFAARFGAEWRRAASVDPGGASLEDPDPTPWHIAGDPAQLMVRVYPHGVFLARPEGVWGHGSSRLGYHARDQIYLARHGVVAGSDLDDVIAGLVRRRRSAFRYCRYCRRARGPEELVNSATCHRCAATWESVL